MGARQSMLRSWYINFDNPSFVLCLQVDHNNITQKVLLVIITTVDGEILMHSGIIEA